MGLEGDTCGSKDSPDMSLGDEIGKEMESFEGLQDRRCRLSCLHIVIVKGYTEVGLGDSQEGLK